MAAPWCYHGQRMKALTTQFDDGKLSNTVATPTCCCCCCCCCCLTTSVLATTTLTKSISKNCNENKDDRKPLLATLAALTIPMSLMLSQAFIGMLISSASTNYESNLMGNFIDQLGSRFVAFLIIYLLMILGLFIISRKEKPIINSIIFIIVFSIAVIAEAFAGMLLILTNPIIYLVVSITIIVLVLATQNRKEAKAKNKSESFFEPAFQAPAQTLEPLDSSSDTENELKDL